MEKKALPENTPVILLVLLLVAHFAWIMVHFEPAYASPDAHGYFYQAKLLAETGKTHFEQESPVQAVGIHWLITEDDKFFSRYPPGFPVLLAALYKIGGPTGALLLNPLLTSASLLLLFFVCRRMMDDWHALAACALLALNPTFNAHSLNAFAHTPVMFLFLAGSLLLLRWTKSEKASTAFFAGFLFGIIPTIRYPDAVLGIGVMAFLFFHWQKERDDAVPGIIAASVGAALPILATLVRNFLAFGSPLKTGYSLTNEQTGFGWSYFQNNATNYAESLMSSGWGVLFLPAIFGIAGMLFYKYSRSVGYLLFGAIVPLVLVYTAYYWSGGQNGAGGLRFFLPTFPLIAFAGMWFISRIQNALATPNWLVLVSLIVIQAIVGIPRSETQLNRSHDMAERNALIEDEMEQLIPENSVVVINRGAHQWIDFAGKWKLADESLIAAGGIPERMARRLAQASEGENDSPSPMQPERMLKIMAHYADLEPEEKASAMANDLKAWANGGTVYWVGSERSIQRFLRQSGMDFDWERVAEIELPELDASRLRNNRSRPGVGGPGAALAGMDPEERERVINRFRQARGGRPGGPGGGGLFGPTESKLAVYRWIHEETESAN